MKAIRLLGCAVTALLLSYTIFSCTYMPDADSFVAPQMADIEAVEAGCFALELKCRLDNPGGMAGNGYGCGIKYGFYLQREGSQEAFTFAGKVTGNSVVATASGLSSGTEYICRAFARSGEYESVSGSKMLKTVEPFKDENFRAHILANFDTDGNGGISQKEARAVDTIKVVTENIKDLAGIEIFTELYYLYCAGISEDKFKFDVGIEGALTALDVSKNTKLDFLSCGHNKIDRLEVKENTLLRTLDCNNTLITSLDLSANRDLLHLEAHDCTRLTEVHFAQKGNMRSIFMHNCNLKKVDITTLPYLDAFNCAHSASLETVDLSGNRYMKVLGVAALPLVEELDLSHNEFLVDLDCEWCESLETVWLHKDAKLQRVVKPEHTNLLYKQ